MSETGRRLVDLEAEVTALKNYAMNRLVDAVEEIRDELRRANDAREAFYVEVSAMLAYLRQDDPQRPEGVEG